MNRVLFNRSWRDSWLLLVACSLLVILFISLRVWVASRIKADIFLRVFSEGLKIFQNLLPVSVEELASPLGRVAFSYEELPVILLLGLWTITRGSECIAGRVGTGTMEMLLAQPLRRISIVGSHSAVTLLGVAALAAASWLGTCAGLAVAEFTEPPPASAFIAPAVNFAGLGVFLMGGATLASALARTRAQAVAVVMGFYVIELAIMIVARLSPNMKWLEWLTFLSAYEPTMLTLGLQRDPAVHWPLFWQYNACLFGLGAAMWVGASAIFSHRDVAAPL